MRFPLLFFPRTAVSATVHIITIMYSSSRTILSPPLISRHSAISLIYWICICFCEKPWKKISMITLFLRPVFPVILHAVPFQNRILFFFISFFCIRKNSGKFPINITTTERAGSLPVSWKKCRKFWNKMENAIFFLTGFPGSSHKVPAEFIKDNSCLMTGKYARML